MSLTANRVNYVKESPTLMLAKKSAELKQQGKNIISLTIGEPDFDTPDNIKEAAIKAINQGITKYTNVDGIPELKESIKNKFKRENNLDYQLNEIIVGSGAKQVIYNLFMATLNIGDEVIIPKPYWVSYPEIVTLVDAKPIFINCTIENNFKLVPKQLADAITSKTKWLLINSPNNPTGAIYSKSELESLIKILSEHNNVNIICDDIYEHVVFDEARFFTLAEIAPNLKERIFIVNGVSKAYAMTGWRIGYGAGNAKIVKAMTIIQSHSTSNPCSISQVAAIEALNGPQDHIQTHTKDFQKKRDLALTILSQAPGLYCYKPEGTFYLFISCKGLLGKQTPNGKIIINDSDFASYLLETVRVSIVPGIAFGIEGYFRISCAISTTELEAACLLIKKACEKLV